MVSITASETENSTDKKPKAVSTGDKIYTWIDSKGDRIYSDVPRDGAEVMEIEKSSEYSTPTPSTTDYSRMKPKEVATQAGYGQFEIASPAHDATVRNSSGDFQVALQISPKLSRHHSVILTVDGQEMGDSGSSIISLHNIDRGSHVLVAHILSQAGDIIMSSSPITIHLHRGGG